VRLRPGVVALALAALGLAAPAAGMHWLDFGHVITVSDYTTEATGATTPADFSANVAVEPNDEPVTCAPAPGSSFPVGATQVVCTADDAEAKTFNVLVTDTRPPVIDPHGPESASTSTAGANVNYTPPSATDIAGPVDVACSPSSGSAFPIGASTVTCTATDGVGLTAQTQFTVTVADVGNPTISVDDVNVEATGTTTVVNYPLSAGDNSGAAPSVDCAGQPPGSSFPVGTTHVTCTATDGVGNSASGSADITVHDTTPPTLTLPASITVEADSPAGKVVGYSASASDLVVGSVSANCDPASGSTFPLGTTTVNCSASDGANVINDSFTVTVTDTVGPTFSSVSPDKVVEANGPGGSVVNYPAATAVDGIDGPIPSSPCEPASGSLFALGATVVTCTATDAHSNVDHASFTVTVRDTTKPTLIVPTDSAAYADSPTSLSATGYGLAHFLTSAQAFDLVDPHPLVSNDVGDRLTIGVHVVTFSATDASGNSASKTAVFEVRPSPPSGTSPAPLPLPRPRTPPANVTNFKATGGDRQVRLSWQIPGGVDHVVITRSLTAGGEPQNVYSGKGTSFTDRGVANGLEYRYLVVSVAPNGDQSVGVAAVAVPKANLLRSPKDGAKLKRAPKLFWTRNPEAAYYNVQLFREQTKILSVWPVKASVALRRTWKYQGRRYRLTRGVYTWYVWPGFGARSAIDYGELLGSRAFEMTR
jgi:hypothetical protein